MGHHMDMTGLRDLLGPLISSLGGVNTHTMLPGVCERLGLPPIVPDGSKRERLEATFSALPDSDLPRVMELYIEIHSPPARKRNDLQDWLWAREPFPEIPKKARRDLARAIPIENLFRSRDRFDALLDRLWVLSDDSSFSFDDSLRDDIARHVHQNRGAWSTEELFEKLGAFDSTHRRFALFMEGLVSPDLLPDEPAQRHLAKAMNNCLRAHGVELRESGWDGGYPVFGLASTRSSSNRQPKNLIFASDQKPDLRFSSAVDNDIEIVTNADKVLVYDRPISRDGLRWRDLQQWWADQKHITDKETAKDSLYRRLRECLPDNSPPQRFLFETYHSSFGKAVPDLPALLPEVWLHWDPKTVKERGRDALFRFRMDFLMLLPHGARVVLEVDGKQHYSDAKGAADTRLYAQMVGADRELKLSGYEVFRFGGAELQGGAGAEMVKTFFKAMFRQFSVTVPGSR